MGEPMTAEARLRRLRRDQRRVQRDRMPRDCYYRRLDLESGELVNLNP